MRGWGGKSPKATLVWSNSRAIRKFATRFYKGRSVGSFTDTYLDCFGKKKFKGNSLLKASQPGP